MRLKRLSGLVAGFLAGIALSGILVAQDARQPIEARALTPEERATAGRDGQRLVFPTGVIDPSAERLETVSYQLRQPPAGRYGIVQLADMSAGAMSRLRNAGVEVLAYYPNNAYLVAWTPRLRERLANLPGVRWAGDFTAEMKIAPSLLDPANAPVSELQGSVAPGHAVEILGFPGADVESFRLAVHKYVSDARLINVYDRERYPAIEVWVPADRLTALVESMAGLVDVYWLSPAIQPELYNRDSVEVIQANTGVSAPNLPTVTPIWDQDLIGTGQIIAVMDSGLDRNEDWFVAWDDGSGPNTALTDAESPTLPNIGTTYPDRKVFGYWIQPGATAYDSSVFGGNCNPFGFHGTHVTGTAAGDSGTRSTPTDPNYDNGDGMAPNAQILFQDIGNDDISCLTIQDFGGSLQQAYDAGARIHSNSWGATTGLGSYNDNSALLDAATRVNEELLVLVAAGNDGASGVGPPATAKNAVAVGYLFHGDSTTANPDSGQGPTTDGRHKPDIQAPGSGIISAAGDSDNSGTIDPPVTSPKSGTSMATPAVAGGAALVRQYFEEGFYPTGARNAADEYAPTGALMKAVLLNGTNLDDFPIFDNVYGWGRIWLDGNLYFTGDDRYLRQWDVTHTLGLATGDQDSFSVDVTAGEELRVTLVWFDVAGSVGAGTQLVNDLDLEVEAPGGSVFLGNVFAGGQSTTGGSADDLNTVEQVRLTSPSSGTYEIQVDGTAVPGNGEVFSDRQGYALVLSAAAPPAAALSAPGSVTASDNGASGIDVSFSSVSGAVGYNIYRASGDCDSVPDLNFRLVGHTETTSFTDTQVIGGYEYSYVVRADNSEREGPRSTCGVAAVVTSTAACNLTPEFDQSSVTAADTAGDMCGIDLDWAAGSSNCPAGATIRYNVYRSTDPLFSPAPGNRVASDLTGVTEWVDPNVMPDTTYFYMVRAEDSTHPTDGNETSGSQRVQAISVGNGTVPGIFSDDPDAVSYMQVGDVWSVSDGQAATGSFSYNSAPFDASIYPNDTCAWVSTPDIELQSGSPELTFSASHNIEANWDGVVVEISDDGGMSWSILTPDGGYPGDFSQTMDPPINACGYPETQGAYNGDTGGVFSAESVDLSAFAGQTVRVRWVLSTDEAAQFEGFYLDDIAITDASTPQMCFVGEEIFADGFEDIL